MALSNLFFYLLVLMGMLLVLFRWRQSCAAFIELLRNSRCLWLLLLWLAALYLSLLYSDAADPALYARKYKKFCFIPFLIVLYAYARAQQRDVTRAFVIGLFVGSGVSALLTYAVALLMHAGMPLSLIKPQELNQHGFYLPTSWFIHSLLFALLAVLCLHRIGSRKRWDWLSALMLIIALSEVLLISTQKTGHLCFIVMLLVYLALSVSGLRSAKAWLLGGGGVLLILVISLANFDQLQSRWQDSHQQIMKCRAVIDSADPAQLRICDSSSGQRLYYYMQSLRRIQAQPWGYGMGDLRIHSLPKWRDGAWQSEPVPNPHNEYLLQGMQLGLLGIVLLLAIFALAWQESHRLPAAAVLRALLAYYGVGCLFNSFLLDAAEGMLFALLLTYIIAEQGANTPFAPNHCRHESAQS